MSKSRQTFLCRLSPDLHKSTHPDERGDLQNAIFQMPFAIYWACIITKKWNPLIFPTFWYDSNLHWWCSVKVKSVDGFFILIRGFTLVMWNTTTCVSKGDIVLSYLLYQSCVFRRPPIFNGWVESLKNQLEKRVKYFYQAIRGGECKRMGHSLRLGCKNSFKNLSNLLNRV